MKQRKGILLVSLLLLLSLLTGCWNRRELNDLAIVMGFGIDKVGKEYQISTQVVNPGEVAERGGGGLARPTVTTFSVKSKTIFEGIRRMTTMTPRRLYFAHIRVLVLSEKVAKEGVKDVLDLFFRDHEVRPDFYVILARDQSAMKMLSTFDPMERIPASKLYKSLETSEKAWAPTISIQLDEFINALMSDGQEPVLTGVGIKGDPRVGGTDENLNKAVPPAFLKYLSIGVFKDDKLVGWLDERESKGYSYVTNKVDSTVGSLPCGKSGTITIEVVRSKTEVKGKVAKGKPHIEISVLTEGNVGEVACSIDLSNPKTIYQLEIQSEQRIKLLMMDAIRKAQKQYKSDIFGFGDAIHRADPKSWEKWKKDWDRMFADVTVTTKVDVKLRRTGKVGNSFIKNMEKEKE